MQSEFLHAWVRKDTNQVPSFLGYYLSAGWFLTGETRPYDTAEGAFTRVIPRRSFDGAGGWGAWELAARYSFVNLNSADVQGGRLSMLMAGVNWYAHSHVKCRFDYGFGHVSGRQPEGDMHIFESRVEIDSEALSENRMFRLRWRLRRRRRHWRRRICGRGSTMDSAGRTARGRGTREAA